MWGEVTVKLIYISALSRAVILITGGLLATTESAIAESCGPEENLFKSIVVPEYICFDEGAGQHWYWYCAGNPTRAVVYFGTACGDHDRCYKTREKIKSSCDNEFQNTLVETCKGSINRSWTNAIKTCMVDANLAYEAVKSRPEACEAYKTAQKNLGVEKPTCDPDGQSQLEVRERIKQAFGNLSPANAAVAEYFVTHGQMPATVEESGFTTNNPSPYLSRISYQRINSNTALLTGTITNQIGGDTQVGQTIVVKAVGFGDPVSLVDYFCVAGTVATTHLPESCRRAISGSTDGQGGTPDTNKQPMASNGRKSQPIISGPGVQVLSQPPEILVQSGECLLYKCGGDSWKAKKKLVVFSTPDRASTQIGSVESGAVFVPINMTEITIKPAVLKVRKRFASLDNTAYWFEDGELIYMYAGWGHGCTTVWTRGYLYGYSKENNRSSGAGCLDMKVDFSTYIDTVQEGIHIIWYKLRLGDGRFGWVMKEGGGDESNLGICFSCEQPSGTGQVPSENQRTHSNVSLKQAVDQWITAFKRTDKCSKECRDFVTTCTRPVKASRADQLNGVTERKYIGFTYAYFNEWYKKYYENQVLVVFEKVEAGWRKADEHTNVDIRACMHF